MPAFADFSLPALAAMAGAVIAAAMPRPATSALSALLVAGALGLRLPATGAVAAALSIAAGLAAIAAALPNRDARRVHALSAVWLLPALSTGLAPAVTPTADHLAAILACLALIAVTGATALWVDGPGRRIALALVLAALPWAPAGGALLRYKTAIALPQEGAMVNWQATGVFAAWLGDAPAWLGWLNGLARVLAIGMVVLAWALRERDLARRLPRPVVLVIAVAAAAALLGESAWSLGAAHLHVAGSPLPVPLPTEAVADPSLVLLALARLLSVAALLSIAPAAKIVGDRSPRARVLASVISMVALLSALAVWTATATGWHGAGWLGDAAAGLTAGALIAATVALPALWLGPSLLRDGAQLLQFGAALVLVGGADAGWRVASSLLP